MFSVKKLTVCIGAALALGQAGVASAAIGAPGALADAYLKLTNFSIAVGNGAGASGIPLCNNLPINSVNLAGVQAVFGPTLSTNGGLCRDASPVLGFNPMDPNSFIANPPVTINGISGSENATATVSLNGVDATETSPLALGTSFSANATVGAGFVKGAKLNAANYIPVPDQYVGGTSQSDGNSLIGTADVLMQAQGMLNTNGSEGSAEATQTLNSDFDLAVGTTQTIELSFNADLFLRTALGQDSITATAQTALNFSVFDRNNNNSLVLSWLPGQTQFVPGFGNVNIIGGSCAQQIPAPVGASCAVYSNPFELNRIDSRNSEGDSSFQSGQPNFFEIELTLPAGNYNFAIGGFSKITIATPIPEPGTLALLGLGLLGLGAGMRKASRRA